GESYSVVLRPDETVWQIPEKEQTWKVAKEYMALGIKHILEGYDHLLFIVCLVLLAGTFKRILVTVTGFTIAHSITLALAALGVVKVSVAPVEAAVALSIVFVAMELARDKHHTLTWRYPIAVSSTFGLLHGFGFAAVLTEIGLPQTEIPTALLFFNVGVEIGQIMFVIASIAVFFAGKAVTKRLREMTFKDVLHRIQQPAGYVVGVLAMFWTLDRVSGFWV
ncbi:MAG: HupE/UreJ family protein, partial [Desulfobulbaceae bacterium]|nr:HupE/UreJ family protein [Desulfobulbaceae bacterium]